MTRTKAIAGGILLALAVLAAGCGSSSSGTPAGAKGSSVALTRLNYTPHAKSSLNLVTWDLALGEPQSLDPILAYDYSPSEVVVNLCDSLLIQTPNGAIVNDLATNVTHPSPLTWVYTIRSGVHFWDGAPMTIGDVIFSIERNMIPKDGSYYLSPWGQFIRSVKQTGSDQVTVTTTYPNVAVNEMMASGLGMVTQKSYVLAKGKAYGTPQGGIMCTGPFEFVRWTPGSDILIKRNPNYWNKSLEPKVNEVDFKFLSDPATLTDALLSGSIDGTYEAPLAGIPRLLASTTGKLWLGRDLQTTFMWIARPGGPLGNQKVREALSMMIDRAGLAKTVYDGTAVPQYAILSAGFQAADPAAYAAVNADSVTKLDLAKAKALVKAANPPNGPAEIVVTQGDTGSIDAATVIQAAGRQLGLNMPIRQLTGEQFGTALFSPAARKSFAVMVGNGYLYTPLEYLMTGIVPNASTNLNDFNDPKTTALMTAAEGTNDVAKQSQLLAAAEARANNWAVPNAGGSIPIEDFAERLYMNHRVTGAPACFCYLTYPWAALLGGS